jgi:hypothetical protein
MPRFQRTAHRASLTAMFAAMSLVFLYLASILPTMRFVAYFLSSVFVMGLVLEEEIGLAWLMFVVVSLLSLLLMPNMLRVVPYVLFFGHYGIGKYYIQTRVKDKVVGYVLKLLYYNVALVLMYLLARQIIEQDLLRLGVGLWLVLIGAEAAFVLYDYLFTKVTAYYFNNIRRLLMKN